MEDKQLSNVLIIENPEKLYIVEDKNTESTINLILNKDLSVLDPENSGNFEELLEFKEEIKSDSEEEAVVVQEESKDEVITAVFLDTSRLKSESIVDENVVLKDVVPDKDKVLDLEVSDPNLKVNSREISKLSSDNEEGSELENSCNEEKTAVPKKPTKSREAKQLETCKYCQQKFPTKKKHKSHNCPVRQSILENKHFVCTICGKHLLQGSWAYHYSTHTKRELKFNCSKCSKQFYTNQHLKQHQKSHVTEPMYSCPHCDKKFVQKHHQQRHITTHSGNKKFKCDLCPSSFLIKHQLIRHRIVHGIAAPIYKCQECSKEFSRQYYLQQHEKIHRGEATFQCDICKVSFAMKQHFVAHQATHSENRPYQCNLCEKSFTLRTYLTQHRATHQPNKKQNYTCKICDKKLSRKIDLQRHEILHTGTKPFQCELCGKTFSLKSYLTNHLHIHSEKYGTIKCPACPKTFMRYSDCKRHKISHSNEKLDCKICLKKFRCKEQLEKHDCGNSEGRTKVCNCEFCGQEFQKKNCLKQHIQQSHSSEINYSCSFCQKKFLLQSQLNRHLKTHRKDNCSRKIQEIVPLENSAIVQIEQLVDQQQVTSNDFQPTSISVTLGKPQEITGKTTFNLIYHNQTDPGNVVPCDMTSNPKLYSADKETCLNENFIQ